MKLRRYLYGAIGLVGFAVVWQLVAVGPLADAALPTAWETLTQLVRLVPTTEFWLDVWQTVLVAIGGFAAALVFGVVVGIAIASSPVTLHATRFVLEFIKPIPPIVVLPLVVLVLGPNEGMGVFLVFFGCSRVFIMQTVDGVYDVDPVAVATARSFTMGRVEVLRRVVLPSTLPHIGTAIRVTIPQSLIIAVVAGLIGGAPGLGNGLLLAQLAGKLPLLFAYVIALGIFGLIFQGVSELIQRRMLHWHPSYRKAVA